MIIPFNKPFLSDNEASYILVALKSGRLAGNNSYFKQVADYLNTKHSIQNLFLTPSGTSALEMGAWLAGLGPGDEVILPSYTFSSTANAIVLTGATPVFCEIDPHTMNADPAHMRSLITEKTRMLLPIDYAGIPCEISAIESIANEFQCHLMIDAAQSYGSYYKGKACGSYGDLATFSFHETKNISCGEGGALVINNEEWLERAHYLQEKGTDRRLVLYGQKTKYHWVDIGSSYLLSDILAAVLLAQLENESTILSLRKKVTDAYQELYRDYKERGCLYFTPYDEHQNVNSHAFWVVFDTEQNKERFITELTSQQVYAYIGYMPLHSSPMGVKLGNNPEALPITEDVASRIVRLPLYADLAREGLNHCIDVMSQALRGIYG